LFEEPAATRRRAQKRLPSRRVSRARAWLRSRVRITNLPPLDDSAMRHSSSLLEDATVKKTAQNSKFDLLVLRRRRSRLADSTSTR
jgi:hypothetical protein